MLFEYLLVPEDPIWAILGPYFWSFGASFGYFDVILRHICSYWESDKPKIQSPAPTQAFTIVKWKLEVLFEYLLVPENPIWAILGPYFWHFWAVLGYFDSSLVTIFNYWDTDKLKIGSPARTEAFAIVKIKLDVFFKYLLGHEIPI